MEKQLASLLPRIHVVGVIASVAVTLSVVGCSTASNGGGGGPAGYTATDVGPGITNSDTDNGGGTDAVTVDITVPDDAVVGTDASGSDVDPSCVPKCDGKSCVSNGCGGTCDAEPCDDNNACTLGDKCAGAICLGSSSLPCDDFDPCTIDACSPKSGCVHGPATGLACDDGNACTSGDSCTVSGCVGPLPISCDDKNPCTTDTCKPSTGCTFAAAADMTACQTAECPAGNCDGLCVASSCCNCGELAYDGYACNSKGVCVSPDSCDARCGTYDAKANCQCDDMCSNAGDCCADKATFCTSCTPSKYTFCCGTGLCTYDSCFTKENETPCAFGCDSATNACKADPCGGYPTTGKCIGTSLYAYCAAATGNGSTATLQFANCEAWEACDDTLGFAWCKATPTGCNPGAQKCTAGSPDSADICQPTGTWSSAPCLNCQTMSVANQVTCPGSIQLTPLTAKVGYQNVSPASGYTGYATSSPTTWPVIYALVLSVRYSADFSQTTVLDGTTTAGDGSFTLKVPATAQPGQDYVVLVAAGYDSQAFQVKYAVEKPTVPDGMQKAISTNVVTGKPYTWATSVANLQASGSWVIKTTESSWALQVYDTVRYIYQNAKNNLFFKAGKSLVVWVRDGSDWSCGACFAPWPTDGDVLLGGKAQSQMYISTSDLKYWSRAVLAHEMGHWVMASYGTSPNEGGTHYLASKTPPGMAWSEGWATFFSSMARGDAVYYDQGGNGMFWMDLSFASYGTGKSLLPFVGTDVLQFMDENRVSALLWGAADHPAEPLKSATNASFWQALTSTQMNNGVFTRGYHRQTWDSVVSDPNGPYGVQYVGLQATTTPAPMVADYLDALLCTDPSKATGIAANKGAYPYSESYPTCSP